MEQRPWYERPTWKGLVVALGATAIGVATKEPVIIWAGLITGAIEAGLAANRFGAPKNDPLPLSLVPGSDRYSDLPRLTYQEWQTMITEAEQTLIEGDNPQT